MLKPYSFERSGWKGWLGFYKLFYNDKPTNHVFSCEQIGLIVHLLNEAYNLGQEQLIKSINNKKYIG